MATNIRINPTAFNPGGRFAGLNQAKVVIIVGDEHADPVPGYIGSANNMSSVVDLPPTRFGWQITADGVNMLDEEYDMIIANKSAYIDVTLYLSKLVQQGLVIVNRNGVVQTPAQILA